MIVTYFRSSSYNAFDFCPHRYFLEYCLGIPGIANKSAELGTITHKALELLASYKLATQQKKTFFINDELGEFKTSDINPDSAIELAYNYYTKEGTPYEWNREEDFPKCKKWLYDVLTWRDGMFSPLKRTVILPEQYFDFTIEEPWAAYTYELPNGEKISGHLAIKGTMDLLVEQGNDIEMIDWKTGARKDWALPMWKNHKTYEKLMEDPQLRLYHYAASRLYPDVKNIFVTIFYIQAGGPESLCFTEEDIVQTKKMLEKRFNIIRNTVKPKLVYPDRKCDWCHYKKNSFSGPTEDYNESICKVVSNDIIKLGLDKVMGKYCKNEAYNNYREGGGRKHENKV